MSVTENPVHAREPISDHEQKMMALGYLHEAWAEARHDGIDGDCLAQACLFAALAELVTTYGEEAAATFTDGLSARIRTAIHTEQPRNNGSTTSTRQRFHRSTRSPWASVASARPATSPCARARSPRQPGQSLTPS
jgi:hypothetical protein